MERVILRWDRGSGCFLDLGWGREAVENGQERLGERLRGRSKREKSFTEKEELTNG